MERDYKSCAIHFANLPLNGVRETFKQKNCRQFTQLKVNVFSFLVLLY